MLKRQYGGRLARAAASKGFDACEHYQVMSIVGIVAYYHEQKREQDYYTAEKNEGDSQEGAGYERTAPAEYFSQDQSYLRSDYQR